MTKQVSKNSLVRGSFGISGLGTLAAGVPIIALDHEDGKKDRLARRTVGSDWRRIIMRPTDTEEVALARLEELLSGTLPRCNPQTVQSLIDRARDNGPVSRTKYAFSTKIPREPTGFFGS